MILHGHSDSPALNDLASELDAPAYSCDGQDANAVTELVESVLAGGDTIDALICTLGSVRATDALDGPTDASLDAYRSNVLGPVNFTRAVDAGKRGRAHRHGVLPTPVTSGRTAAAW